MRGVEMICLDCGYETDCWDMNYSNKLDCYLCPECESDNVEFVDKE